MPRGSKICNSCQASNGPRAFNCKSCGAAFTFKDNKITVPVVAKEQPKQISTGQPVDVIKHLVYVPSGECPVKLTNMTPEGAVEWARKIRDANPKIRYSSNALRYWMRSFVNPFENEELYDELSAVL